MKGKNALSDADDCGFDEHILFYIFIVPNNCVAEQTIF